MEDLVLRLASHQDRIAENLRCLRTVFGHTQSDIARVIHVCRCTYVQYETGRSAPPVEILLHLASFYSISIDMLLEEDWRAFTGRLMHADQASACLPHPALIFRHLSESQQQVLTAMAIVMLRQENLLQP